MFSLIILCFEWSSLKYFSNNLSLQSTIKLLIKKMKSTMSIYSLIWHQIRLINTQIRTHQMAEVFVINIRVFLFFCVDHAIPYPFVNLRRRTSIYELLYVLLLDSNIRFNLIKHFQVVEYFTLRLILRRGVNCGFKIRK